MKTSNRIILCGKRIEIFKKISENPEGKTFFLKAKPSIPLFVYLLNNSKIEKLIVLPCIKRLMPEKMLRAFKKSRIKVIVEGSKIGRPKIDAKRFGKIIGKEMSDKKKIERLGISRRVFYYYKKKKEINP